MAAEIAFLEHDSEDDFDMTSSQPYPPSQRSSGKGSVTSSQRSSNKQKNNIVPSDESSPDGEASGYVVRSPPSTGRKRRRRLSIPSDSEADTDDNGSVYEPPLEKKKPLFPHKKIIKTDSSKTPSKSRPGSARKLVPDKNQPSMIKYLTPKKEVDPVIRQIDFDHDYATPGPSTVEHSKNAVTLPAPGHELNPNDSVVEVHPPPLDVSMVDLTADTSAELIDDSASTVVYPIQDTDNVMEIVTPPNDAAVQPNDLAKTVGYVSHTVEPPFNARGSRPRRDSAETILYNHGDSRETHNEVVATESDLGVAANTAVAQSFQHSNGDNSNVPDDRAEQSQACHSNQEQSEVADTVNTKGSQNQKDLIASPIIIKQETIEQQRKVIAQAVSQVKSANQGAEMEENPVSKIRERNPSSDSVRVTSTSNIVSAPVESPGTSQPGPTLVNLKLEVEVDLPSNQVSGPEDVSAPSDSSTGKNIQYFKTRYHAYMLHLMHSLMKSLDSSSPKMLDYPL